MAVVIALALLVVAGLPLAYAITRDLVVASVLAPIITGLQCTVAAVAMLLVGGPFGPWLAVATAGGWALAAALIRRPRAPMPTLGIVDLAVMYAPLLLPTLLVRRPPVAWDARSIWWFHAAWIDRGSTAFRDALGNPAFTFSHPDYPPFASSTVAAAWRVTGDQGLWVAQAVSTVLTLAAVAMLAYAVRHLVPTARPAVSRLVALGVALGLWWVADYGIAAGYGDHLWAAALAAAAVLLFVDGRVVAPAGVAPATGVVGFDDASGEGADEGGGGRLALAVVLLVVAALTKNEGFVAVVIVAVLFTARARHHLRRAASVWVPVAAGLAWSVASRAFGATSDLSSSPRITQLTHGDLQPLERIQPTVAKLAGHVGWPLAGALVVSILGVVVLRGRRRELRLAPVLWPWLLIVAYGAGLVATYVISPYDIKWHLLTSADRVSVLLVLLALSTVASWVLVALAPDDPRDPTASSLEPSAAASDVEDPSGGVRAGW